MSAKLIVLLYVGLFGLVFLLAGCVSTEDPKQVVAATVELPAFVSPDPTMQVPLETAVPQNIIDNSNIYLPIIKLPGPLTVSTINPRYFADSSGKIVYLTGSHTWPNLQDNGFSYPPPVFDYPKYLNFLKENNHNFFRLWAWEQTRWIPSVADNNFWYSPSVYMRTGPGTALDGLPKFDLTKYNQAYFDRLRERVVAAEQQGIYVSIMLFDGWSVASTKGIYNYKNPWQAHPFNQSNNINGINGDTNGDNSGEETHELKNANITALQEAYVRKVIDTVNDLNNVLYEISNESHANSQQWQYHMINYIKNYEATLPRQHPVGMTVEYPNGSNADLFASPADWISMNGDISNPPVANGTKVILSDTDHLCGLCGDRQWVWKSFTRGENPIFMDGYDVASDIGFEFNDPVWVSLRANLGYTRMYAERINLAAMTPQNNLCSSTYCLANPTQGSAEYLAYLPNGGRTTINLSSITGTLFVEWFNPATGNKIQSGTVQGGATRSFTTPFAGDSVLYVYQ